MKKLNVSIVLISLMLIPNTVYSMNNNIGHNEEFAYYQARYLADQQWKKFPGFDLLPKEQQEKNIEITALEIIRKNKKKEQALKQKQRDNIGIQETTKFGKNDKGINLETSNFRKKYQAEDDLFYKACQNRKDSSEKNKDLSHLHISETNTSKSFPETQSKNKTNVSENTPISISETHTSKSFPETQSKDKANVFENTPISISETHTSKSFPETQSKDKATVSENTPKRDPLLPTTNGDGFDRIIHNQQEALYYNVQPDEMPLLLANTAILIAPQELKQKLEAIRNSDLRSTKLLLTGEPGTGKSTVALAIAQKLKRLMRFNYKLLDATQMEGEVRNSGERNLRTAFFPILEANQNNRWVVILEELDKLVVPTNPQERTVGTALALNMILNQCLNNQYIVIFGITNNSKDFPTSLKSRFQEIKFSLPKENERYLIIQCILIMLQQKGVHIDENCFQKVFLDSVANNTNRMSVRMIEDALYEAAQNIFTPEEITREQTWWLEDNGQQNQQNIVPEQRRVRNLTQQIIRDALNRHKPSLVMSFVKNSLPYVRSFFNHPIVSNVVSNLASSFITQGGTNLSNVLITSGHQTLARWTPWYTNALAMQVQEQQVRDSHLTHTILETTANDIKDSIIRQNKTLKLSENGYELSLTQFLSQLFEKPFFTKSFTRESIKAWIQNPQNPSLLVCAPDYPMDGRDEEKCSWNKELKKSETGQLDQEKKEWDKHNFNLNNFVRFDYPVESTHDLFPQFFEKLKKALN